VDECGELIESQQVKLKEDELSRLKAQVQQVSLSLDKKEKQVNVLQDSLTRAESLTTEAQSKVRKTETEMRQLLLEIERYKKAAFQLANSFVS